MENKRLGVCLTVVALLFVAVPPAGAHGIIGQRFFPATLAIDDPFVADELSLPTVSFMRFHSSGECPPLATSGVHSFSRRSRSAFRKPSCWSVNANFILGDQARARR